MSDLIDRDALKKAIGKVYGCDWDYIEKYFHIAEAVNSLPSVELDNGVHLCEFCKYDYPECPAEMSDVIFGNGKGQDNVCACTKFEIKPEPKKGKWIYLDECANVGYYCDQCNKRIVKDGWSKTVKKINFCPNCGARLE